MNSRLQDRFTRVDAAALAAFIVVWGYFIVMITRAFFFADEGFYLTMIERFANADRPIVDEWHLSQLGFVLLCIPYKFFVALTNGTDGIVLFMRGLFLAVNAVFFWIMYIKLRAYRRLALIASLLFGTCVPFLIYFCNYYTMAPRLLMIVCLILYTGKQKPFSLIAAGVILSCAVLAQPGLALLYLVYCAFVAVYTVRDKKGGRFGADYAFCLNVHTWKYISLGVLVSAAVFLTWLFARSGFRSLLAALPNLLFTDPEYDFTTGGTAKWFFFSKLADAVRIYGLFFLIPAFVILALSAAYACGAFRARRETARRILFALSCAAWILSCIVPFRIPFESIPNPYPGMYQTPLFWFGLACFLLCERKNKRIFFFWIVGLLSSLCMDLFSDVALSLGLPISFIADLVFFADLVGEIRTEKAAQKVTNMHRLRSRKKEKRAALCMNGLLRLTCFCFACWFAFVLFFLENASRSELTGAPFFDLTHRIETGPCRSVYYDETYGKSYDDKLSDIDTLKRSSPKNLFVFGMNPELYLYAGLPYATYSSYTWGEPAYLKREIRYWQRDPDRLPECVYIPVDGLYNDHGTFEEALPWVRALFDPLCTYTLQTGKSGYILYVSKWNPEITAAAQ